MAASRHDAASEVDGGARPAVDGGHRAEGEVDESSEVPLPGFAAAEFEHCEVTPVGPAESTSMEVPNELTGALFGLLEEVCVQGGFNLGACAGRTVAVTSVGTVEVVPGAPDSHFSAHVISLDDDTVCCAYRSYFATPGLVPANCGPAYPARAAMQRCNIIEHPRDPARTVEEVRVPASLSDESPWRERAKICRDGDYDLAACAGKQATLVTFNQNWLNEAREPAKAWILTYETEVCCIWQTDGGEPAAMLARKCELQP